MHAVPGSETDLSLSREQVAQLDLQSRWQLNDKLWPAVHLAPTISRFYGFLPILPVW